MMRALFLVLIAGSALAQTSLGPPQVGFMQDAAGSLRAVYGIAGNFLIGDVVCGRVLSVASSGSYGLVKTSSAVLVIDAGGGLLARIEAPDGPALFAFSRRGEPALAYVPSANWLIAWTNGAFQTIPLDLSEPVLSIGAPDPEHAALIVQRDEGLWDIRMLLATAEIDSQRAIAGITAPVLLLPAGELLYRDAETIVIRKSDGSERHVAAQLPDTFVLQQMGDGWVQVRDLAGGPQLAVRATEGREQFYQLPEAGR